MFDFLKKAKAATELELALTRSLGETSAEIGKLALDIVQSGVRSLSDLIGQDQKKLDPLVVAMYSVALDAYQCATHAYDADYILVCQGAYEDLRRQIQSKYFTQKPSVADTLVINASAQTFNRIT